MVDRRVAFEGVHNFRDLGGYQTEDGRATRWGRLFRSDALHDLTIPDIELFRTLGVAAIVDLRSPNEVQRTGRGRVESEPHRFVSAPVLSNYETNERRAVVDEGYLTRRYLQYLEIGGPAFVQVFTELAEPANYPLVFNCFLGKDRTGVVASLVLSSVGVKRDLVVEDYALSESPMVQIVAKLKRDPRLREEIEGDDPILLSARRATMANFLAEVDERFGGVAAWARSAGVSSEIMAGMADLILAET
ncbi:MAG TPA: tyrosine-protein phosphatase [Acidimicrobiales bacterium]|jgi:protein-tyrosine phosphatase